MSVSALMEQLASLRVVLSLDGERLRVNAPRGVLTAELEDRIRAQREVICELLRRAQEPASKRAVLEAHGPGEPAPLTPVQQQLWFLDRLDPGTAFLNIPLVMRLHGRLDVQALSEVIVELGRRHDALTSRITLRDGELCQMPSGRELELALEDYSELEECERQRTILERKQAELRRPFDLDSSAPLARCYLFRYTTTDHLLLLVVNHVVFDGPSQELFVQELARLYEARSTSRPLPPGPRLCFSDFARWQKSQRDLPGRAADLDHWRQKLHGMPLRLELPTDRPRAGSASHRSHQLHGFLDRELSQRLRRMARAHGATTNMAALASLQVLLWRYSGQSDFGVGMPLQNRSREDCEQMIGMFLNTVAVRSELSEGGGSFAELLGRVRDAQIDALAHGNVSFDELLQILAPGRRAQQARPFQVFYSFQDSAPTRLSLSELALDIEPTFTGFAMTDLTFWMHDHGERLWIAVEGAADIFDANTVDRVYRSWQRLLQAVADDPNLGLGELPLMNEADARHVLHELNDTARSWDEQALLHRLFEQVVDQKPEDVALIFEDRTLSYRELDARANRLAHWLVQHRVGPESLVGLCVHKGIEQVVAMMAILKAGGAYVGLDPTYPAERISSLLADSEARILISSSDIAPRITTDAELLLVDRDAGLVASQPATRLTRPERSGQLAYIIYTSGSSGRPKGVMVEHRNVTSFLAAVHHAIKLDGHGVWLAGASISFDMSVIEIIGSLCYGRRLVLLGDSVLGEVLDPRFTIPELVKRHGVTHFQCTPSQAQMLLQSSSGRDALAALEQLLCGGETIPEALAEELCKLVSGEVVNIYGPTETTVYATLGPMEKGGRAIGRPIPNTSVFVLDPSGKPVPQGAPGELCIGSPGVTRGYLKRPELTAERFIENVIRPEVSRRLYRSGDLVRYASDGTLLYLGRNDHQVKIRGYRIELGEIESAARKFAGVRDVVVVVRGQDAGKHLVGYLVVSDDYAGDEALRAALRAQLPDFMVPPLLVQLAALPLNANGKVDRSALPEPGDLQLPSAEYVAPRNERERRLCEIWQQALGRPKVGLSDNFFDLGGQSLMAVKLSNEVERAFGVRLPLSTLFECPTIALFAERLGAPSSQRSAQRAEPWTTVVPIQPRGARPPLFCVAGVGGNPMNLRHVALALGEEQPFYGLQFRGVDGQLPPHRDLQAMAEEFLSHIRAVQPAGPYCLGGYSGGGLAAYEMAQRLRARGELVSLVVLLDTQNPKLPQWPLRDRVDAHLENLRQKGARYLSERASARVREEFTRATRMVRARLAQRQPFKYRHEAVWQASEEAIERYVPAPYDGKVLLLRADPRLTAEGGIGPRAHESNGWRALVKELEVVELVCSHADIVGPEFAGAAAAALSKVLAATRTGPQTSQDREAPSSTRVRLAG